MITLDIPQVNTKERNLMILLGFSNGPSLTKKSNVFNRLAPLTKKLNKIKNLAREPKVMSNEARSEPSDIVSDIVSGVVSGVMTIVVKGSIVTIVVSVPYSDFPLEPIVVSHEAVDYSSESEHIVVQE